MRLGWMQMAMMSSYATEKCTAFAAGAAVKTLTSKENTMLISLNTLHDLFAVTTGSINPLFVASVYCKDKYSDSKAQVIVVKMVDGSEYKSDEIKDEGFKMRRDYGSHYANDEEWEPMQVKAKALTAKCIAEAEAVAAIVSKGISELM